jgi:hypothetical protein
MAVELEIPTGGAKPSPSTVPPLEQGKDVADIADARGGDSAESLAIEHEGNRGGRGRIDGLVPGSPAAASADKLYDCIRKWQDRNPGQIHPQEKSLHPDKQKFFVSRRKIAPTNSIPLSPVSHKIKSEPPPPLPSMGAGNVRTDLPPSGDPADLLVSARAALVAWAGTDIEPLLIELIKLLEEWREYAREKKLRLAHLPQATIDEINRDCEWDESPKKILCESGSRVLAKLLNKGGISAEYKDEIFCGLAAILIAGSELRTMRRINQLIAAANAGAVKTTDQK